MRFVRRLLRERTNAPRKLVTTFSVSGQYLPPYGKTLFSIRGQGAPGNPETGSSPATNPSTGGTVSGSNPPSGGNYAGVNPTTYGFNTSFNAYTNYATPDASGTPISWTTSSFNYQVNYTPNEQSANTTNNNPTYGPSTPSPSYTGPNSGPAGHVIYHTYNYTQTSSSPGSAYYNPSSPGSSNFNPTVPGNPLYNPSSPGNPVYVPGDGGNYAGANPPVYDWTMYSQSAIVWYTPSPYRPEPAPGGGNNLEPSPGGYTANWTYNINGSTVAPDGLTQQYSQTTQNANGQNSVPAYIGSGYDSPGPPRTTWHFIANYVQNAAYPGNAYYNPGNPGYSYTNSPVPGNPMYNVTTPGNAGTPAVVLGVPFPGGPASAAGATVAETPISVPYSGAGIGIVVPAGGYVIIENK